MMHSLVRYQLVSSVEACRALGAIFPKEATFPPLTASSLLSFLSVQRSLAERSISTEGSSEEVRIQSQEGSSQRFAEDQGANRVSILLPLLEKTLAARDSSVPFDGIDKGRSEGRRIVIAQFAQRAQRVEFHTPFARPHFHPATDCSNSLFAGLRVSKHSLQPAQPPLRQE